MMKSREVKKREHPNTRPIRYSKGCTRMMLRAVQIYDRAGFAHIYDLISYRSVILTRLRFWVAQDDEDEDRWMGQ